MLMFELGSYFFKIFHKGTMADSFPYPYGDEMKGLAKASKIPLGWC